MASISDHHHAQREERPVAVAAPHEQAHEASTEQMLMEVRVCV